MTTLAGRLLAAGDGGRTFFEWGRIQSNSDWILPVIVMLALVVFATWWYRRDAVELSPLARFTLTTLRLLAFCGLLWIYLEPQWRTERDVVTNSQAMLLVDTSLSMGLPDESFPSSPTATNRAQRVIQALEGEKLVGELRRTHDVIVARFDASSETVATLARLPRDDKASDAAKKEPAIAWATALAPQGLETRLGQSLRTAISEQHTGPLSGIVLFTDGGQNSGPGANAAVAQAVEAGVKILPVGIGSSRQPSNVRISDLVAPARAFPRDTFTITGYVQAQGMAGRAIRAELLSAEAGDDYRQPAGDARLESTSEIRLGPDGEVAPVRFDLTPEEVGRRTFTLRLVAPDDDANPNDNQQQVDVEIVDQKTRVLLFASGPMREYRFLHTMLFRDDNMEVDILLGTAQPGMAQEASRILDTFPSSREELDKYDAIVAFDPDWTVLDAETVDNLEHWVADQAGGLIVIPGPVNGDAWTEKPELAKIRDLYPVEFRRRFSLSEAGDRGASEAFPLEFTREGLEAEFLWLRDSSADSQQAWATFPGVYECLAVRGPKPGATVLARSNDPRAGGPEQSVYFAGQFYGSGRVFYEGSAEMWRLRGLEPSYFEQLYTKLIRYVSQGRLLRGSGRGVLLTERDRYFLGQTVDVRAQLNNASLEPLSAPKAQATVHLPDNSTEAVELMADGSRPGSYSGQFVVRQEGAVRIELQLPDSPDQKLSRRIQVRVPDLERENPQRNDALLGEIASATGGRYYLGVEDALGLKSNPPVWQELPDRSLTRSQSDRPRPLWDNWQALLAIAGCLCLEWLLRRLWKLA